MAYFCHHIFKLLAITPDKIPLLKFFKTLNDKPFFKDRVRKQQQKKNKTQTIIKAQQVN